MLLVCLLIALVQVSGRWRTILLPPTIYLASFVWETRLAAEPAITRQLMIGAILIVMMNARPQGLLGRGGSRPRHERRAGGARMNRRRRSRMSVVPEVRG